MARTLVAPDAYMSDCPCNFCKAWDLYLVLPFELPFQEFIERFIYQGASVWSRFTDEFGVPKICVVCEDYHAVRSNDICNRCVSHSLIAYCQVCNKFAHVSTNTFFNEIRVDLVDADNDSGFGTICRECIGRDCDGIQVHGCVDCDRLCVDSQEQYTEDTNGNEIYISFPRRLVGYVVSDGNCDERVCHGCWTEVTSQCIRCAGRYRTTYMTELDSSGNLACGLCFDNHYSHCDVCDEYYLIAAECRCYRNIVRAYNFRPSSFNRWLLEKQESVSHTVFFGTELEMCFDGSESKAKISRDLLDYWTHCGAEFMYAKSDGTVRNGVEFVTHPFSWRWLKAHRNTWIDFFDACKSMKVSGDDSTAGMHVHISRSSIKATQLYAIMRFIHGNPFLIEMIGKRSVGDGGNMDRYAKMYDTKRGIIERVKGRDENWTAVTGGDRYHAVNLNNRASIELRFFKGVGDFEPFMSNMEFCHSLVEFSKVSGMNMWPHTYARYVISLKKRYPILSKTLINTFGKDV